MIIIIIIIIIIISNDKHFTRTCSINSTSLCYGDLVHLRNFLNYMS